MRDRLDLHECLCKILNSNNVYFQPPENVRMNYPAIVYSLGTINKLYANDDAYKFLTAYTVVLIDKNPDTEFLVPILTLPYCSFDRFYRADNLNHWVFTLYH